MTRSTSSTASGATLGTSISRKIASLPVEDVAFFSRKLAIRLGCITQAGPIDDNAHKCGAAVGDCLVMNPICDGVSTFVSFLFSLVTFLYRQARFLAATITVPNSIRHAFLDLFGKQLTTTGLQAA